MFTDLLENMSCFHWNSALDFHFYNNRKKNSLSFLQPVYTLNFKFDSL